MDIDLPDFSRANCLGADPEVFFPEGGSTSELLAAKRVCAACEIRETCAEWAIHYEEAGLWGGLLPKERRQIRTERGIAVKTPHLAIAMRGVA